jgi:hypothetical protein
MGISDSTLGFSRRPGKLAVFDDESEMLLCLGECGFASDRCADNMRVSWLGGFVLFLVHRRAFGQHEYDEIHHFCDEHDASLRDIIVFDSGKYPSPDDTTYMAELYADKNKFVQAKTVMYGRNSDRRVTYRNFLF